jgi:peptidoglycan/LPS O-acetylase OafA/YrhL
MSLYVMLALGFLVAAGLDRIPARRRSRLRVVVVAAVALTLLPVLPYPSTADATPAYFRPGGAVSRIPDGAVVLVVPFAHQVTSTAPMLWQSEAGFRFVMPEGYFVGPGDGHAIYGPPPSALTTTLSAITDGGAEPAHGDRLRTELRDQMRALAVHTVVAGPMAHHDGVVRFLTWLLGSPPQSVQGVELWTLS